MFFPLSKQCLNLLIMMVFSASVIISPPHISKTFPFEDFFHLGKPKKRSLRTRSGNREGGAWGHAMTWCGLVHSLITHHETSKCVKRIFKKHSLKLNTASHNNASCYTALDRFLEHSLSQESLYYKGLPSRDFWVSPYIPHLYPFIHPSMDTGCFQH